MLIALTPANSFGFRLLFLLHILSVVVAFAPGFVWPLMGRQRRATGGAPGAATASTTETPAIVGRVLSPVVHGGALVLAGLFGLGLVGASKVGSQHLFKMDQTWISIGLLLWFLMLGLFFLGLLPLERRLARGGDEPTKRAALDQRLSMLYGGMHLLFLLQVINMVWQVGGK